MTSGRWDSPKRKKETNVYQENAGLAIPQKIKELPWSEVKKWKSLSRVQLFATPWTVACQASLSMGILQVRILEWVAMPLLQLPYDPAIPLQDIYQNNWK